MTHLHFLHSPATPAVMAGNVRQAFLLLRTVFTVAPIVFGLDKFLGLLTDWEQYLAPWVNGIVPGDAHQAMLAVGVVEILAGVLVAESTACSVLRTSSSKWPSHSMHAYS